MSEVVFDSDGLVITKVGTRFFVRYDAGAHQPAVREDEISPEEAQRMMSSDGEATKVLFELQNRLIQTGINPYVSNIKS